MNTKEPKDLTLFDNILQINFNSSLVTSYASLIIFVNIGLGNGLLSVWHRTITWTNVDLLPVGPIGQTLFEYNIFIQENAFKNVICKKSLILFKPQCMPNAGHDSTWREHMPYFVPKRPFSLEQYNACQSQRWTTTIYYNDNMYGILWRS